jgi:excisionase family DNA binding protein
MESSDNVPTRPDAEVTSANDRAIGETSEMSGRTTTKQAAKALGVSRRMVQEYVRRGELDALAEGEGVNKRYYVSIDSLHRLRERRRREAKDTPDLVDVSPDSGYARDSEEGIGTVLRGTIERLEARAAEAAELRARLELTTQAESTLQEALERERERADRAEEELQELRTRLEAFSVTRDASETGVVSSDGKTSSDAHQPARQRSWLYRFFFGP